jgi:hypothetical protein
MQIDNHNTGLTNLRFDLSNFHSLFEAFDHTGRRLYGEVWQGDEAFARTTKNPEPTRLRRAAIVGELKEIDRQIQHHSQFMKEEFGAEEHQKASDTLGQLYQKQAVLGLEIKDLPHLTDFWIKDHEAFERRLVVESELTDGFKSKEMLLYMGPSTIVEWNSWAREKAFKVYFGLSMIRAPYGDFNSRRRGPALVKREEFAEWLKRFKTQPDHDQPLTSAASCERWLTEQITKDGTKRHTKDEYRGMAIGKFPGLSARRFDRIWDATVPASWKAPGARHERKER